MTPEWCRLSGSDSEGSFRLLQAPLEHACSQVKGSHSGSFHKIDQKHKLLEGKPGLFHLHIFWTKTVLIFLIFFFRLVGY